MVLGAVLTVLTAVLVVSLALSLLLLRNYGLVRPRSPARTRFAFVWTFCQKVWWQSSFAARKWALRFCRGHGKTGGQLLVHKYCHFLKSVIRLLGQYYS